MTSYSITRLRTDGQKVCWTLTKYEVVKSNLQYSKKRMCDMRNLSGMWESDVSN
jgi:hypothetical protein